MGRPATRAAQPLPELSDIAFRREQATVWDPARKLGGLVLEVKGDFCGQVRSMLRRTGREADYIEVGLDTGVCYNPLHNELDPYAVAYAVADVCGMAADQIPMTTARTSNPGRLVLVDGTELDWQRARYREGRHIFAPVDPVLVGLNTLQHWLWSPPTLMYACVRLVGGG